MACCMQLKRVSRREWISSETEAAAEAATLNSQFVRVLSPAPSQSHGKALLLECIVLEYMLSSKSFLRPFHVARD